MPKKNGRTYGPCSREGCPRPAVYAKLGLCNAHYQSYRVSQMTDREWLVYRDKVREYKRRVPEKVKEWVARSIIKHKAHAKNQRFLRKYGLTVAQRDAMDVAQGGLCAICHTPPRKTKHSAGAVLFVDHDHGTGRVRELLCNACNRTMGLLKDSDSTLHAMSEYLRRHAHPIPGWMTV